MPTGDKIKKFFTEKAPALLHTVAEFVPDKGALGILRNIVLNATPDIIKPEDKAEGLAIIEQEFQQLELEEKDRSSARDHDVRIQETSNASWLAKNVSYCIDCFISLLWGFLTIYLVCIMLQIIKKEVGVDYTGVTAIWGGVTALMTQVVNFHRGSSKSSEDKQKQIEKMINK